jgi:hypothetical protein
VDLLDPTALAAPLGVNVALVAVVVVLARYLSRAVPAGRSWTRLARRALVAVLCLGVALSQYEAGVRPTVLGPTPGPVGSLLTLWAGTFAAALAAFHGGRWVSAPPPKESA